MDSSSSDDQMDMMMMMQMDKLSEICGAYNDIPELPSIMLGNNNNNVGAAMPHLYNNPHDDGTQNNPHDDGTQNFMHLQSTLSFPDNNNNNNHSFHDEQQTSPDFSRFCNGGGTAFSSSSPSQKRNSMAAMREMIFRIAAMQPIHIDPESVKPPKRRNVKISKDPQSVAARHRRERISERIRILQRLVPGGTKMDTASMLDEAIHYVKFLKTQVQSLERAASANNRAPLQSTTGLGFPVAMSSSTTNNGSYFPMSKPTYQNMSHNVQHYTDV